jgi:hypothetical protein
MKNAIFAAAALLLACLGLTVTAATASAHTPTITADCSGVHLNASSYDGNQANTWTVTIDGVTQSGTFAASFSQTFAVPQAGATTPWSARIRSYDGAYDSGVQSGTVGPCGQSDACTGLTGNQPPGTACTPPASVVRSDAGKTDGCHVTFEGHTYGAGDLTYDTVFEDGYVFNPATNGWDLVTDTTGEVKNIKFSPWTKAQQIKAGCIDKPADDTEVEGVQDHTTPTPPAPPASPSSAPTQASAPQVPTVIDAGLTGAVGAQSPVGSGDSSSVGLAGAVAGSGVVLILCAAFARRRRSHA